MAIEKPHEPHVRSAAGVLGPPPRLPDPSKTWDELVEEAAAAEYLANEQGSSDETTENDD